MPVREHHPFVDSVPAVMQEVTAVVDAVPAASADEVSAVQQFSPLTMLAAAHVMPEVLAVTEVLAVPVDAEGDQPKKRRKKAEKPEGAGKGKGISHAEQQEKMYGLLRGFREREGHANVPRAKVEGGEYLGVWLSHQRTRYKLRTASEEERKKQQRTILTDEEVARLEALDVSWDVVVPNQRESMIDLLRVYYEREGHGNAPRSHVENGEKLGGWLVKQRQRYQLRTMSEAEKKERKIQRSVMTDEEAEALAALGVTWFGR